MFKQLVKLTQKGSPAFNLQTQNLIFNSQRSAVWMAQQQQRMFSYQNRFGQQNSTSLSQDLKVATMTPKNQLDKIQAQEKNKELLDKVEDYEFNPSHHTIAHQPENFTKQQLIEKHPLQLIAEKSRHSTNIVGKLKKNQIALTNLPANFTPEQAIALCRESVPGLEVYEHKIVHSLNTKNPQTAFIILDLAGERQVVDLTKKMRHIWVGDKLIKLRYYKDAKKEHFNQRTLILRNIPTSFQVTDIIELFDHAGAITAIELPTKSRALEETAKGQFFHNKEYEIQEERQRRQAQKVIEDNLRMDEDYHKLLISHFGEEGARKFLAEDEDNHNAHIKGKDKYEILDIEKINSIIRAITVLQSEGVQITNSKELIQELRHQLDLEKNEYADVKGASVPKDGVRTQDENLTHHSENIKQIVQYLTLNQDNLNTEQQQELNKWSQSSNPVQELIQTSREEVAFAYDTLIQLLEQREELITQRLFESVKHFGDHERILLEQTNDKLQDMPKVYDFAHKYRFKVEEILSLQEQIANVNSNKSYSDEQRFIGLLKGRLNPFKESNFTQEQINNSSSTTLDGFEYKKLSAADPRMFPSLNRMLRKGKGFLPRVKSQMDEIIAEVRDRLELPFDELYHKERNLLQAVVEAEKAIRRKEETFKLSILNGKTYDMHATDFLGEPVVPKSAEQSYHDKQQKKADKLLQEKLRMKDQDASTYTYQNSLQNKYESLIEQGLMSADEYERAKGYAKELDQDNLGYCFITFSHTDEAKILLFENDFSFINHNRVTFHLKQKLDHGDLDPQYTMDQIKNDAMMVDEIKELRQVRKDLRDFEANIDAHMPKARKLKEFRDFARDIIENKPYRMRQAKMSRRTREEEREVDEKIRKLQKENPSVDLTPLFNSDRADAARKEMHKRQYASYKAFTFLKNGVKKAEDTSEPAAYSVSQRKLEENDPYNFPALNQSVNTILSSQIDIPTILDHGEKIDTPGRRFGYTDQEFLEAYLGKDFRRMPDLNTDDNLVLEYQEDWKHKYKIDDYLHMPKIEERKQRIKDLKLDFQFDEEGNVTDPQIRRLINQTLNDQDKYDFEDIPHPEDKDRSYMKDLQNIQDKIDAGGPHKAMNGNYLNNRYREIREEYGLYNSGEDWFRRVMDFKRPRVGEDQQNDPEDASQDSKFESDYKGEIPEEEYQRSTLSPHQHKINKEYLHEIAYNKKNRLDIQSEDYQNINNLAEKIERPVEDVYNALAQHSVIGNKNTYGGKNYQDQAYGIADDYDLDEELNKMNSRTRSTPQGLRQFSQDADQDSDLSEREDEDIYAHYKKQMEKEQLARQEESMTENEIANEYTRLTQNLEKKVPTNFNDYYQGELRGDSPFQQQADAEEAFDFNPGEDQYYEVERDNDLYIRELHGRFMGQKLSPRQFELITGVHMAKKGQNTLEYSARDSREKYLINRDWIRLNEERAEKLRRQKVISGEWTEEDSHQKIRKAVKDYFDKQPSSRDKRNLQEDYLKAIELYQTMDNPGRLFEKEYHFDETLGQSLQDHVEELKKTFPDLRVQTRRDRDGFAIVKTIYKPQFKYDLDMITKLNDEEVTRISNECQEAMLELIYPEGIENHFNNQLNNKEQAQENKFDLDFQTKEALNNLVKKRMSGEIDRFEFKQNLADWKENATFDKTQRFNPQSVNSGIDRSMDDIFSQIKNDRRLIQHELSRQLKTRQNQLRQFTKRKHEDFVKPRVSEKNLFNVQTMQLDDIANDMEANLPSKEKQEEEDFDRAAYEKLRAEIKQRRDAKESILRQGYPEFKPYMRL